MVKRKAESPSQAPGPADIKKFRASATEVGLKSNLLDDSDSGSDSDGGVNVKKLEFTINHEYAKRFEHNKKREELQRLEEKYQDTARKAKGQYGDKYEEDSESSDDEEEDDEGILATEELDAQISDALNAIRSKDPRVYKTDATFYTPIEEYIDVAAPEGPETKKQKPMYLGDYHRENLLKGHLEGEEKEAHAPQTFAQEQADLKKMIVKSMHDAAADDPDDEANEDGEFLVPKSKSRLINEAVHPSRVENVNIDLDIASAEKNPETFLSNFMAARAWVPSDGARFQPLESDDEEEDERAEKFEEAYNLRFEDSQGSNEVLKSYARDIIAAKSVRREEPSGRKKQRDVMREKVEASKKEREAERAQLRRLKIEEAEEKLKKIKKAAGIRGKTLRGEEWADFLDNCWDDEMWESEMNKRFGEEYYAELEAKSDDEYDEAEAKRGKRKVRKPKWDDDIDIKDIIPEFDEDSSRKVEFALSESESSGREGDSTLSRPKASKDRQHEKQAKKKATRLERKKLEELVDSKMGFDITTNSNQPTLFRYRDTSPTTFGLTARDILMAPDASLNEFAGLKKMATFRDAEKKRKDKKKLGKKARLRQWRKETFGNENGPEIILNNGEPQVEADDDADVLEMGRKKKKRSRKSKTVPRTA
ncbi:KRRI-Interacting protein 1 [Cadophora gregata]|uniref:KRRI-Interacting protein 1 n=1 Tax=Cadophora gregata TaxID=51156 RepID=UPI0026DA763B|nr:KRRI-Interacting protein 1 [Cadophora gregata]KAK0113139.1 KRRI-Interacting protein 1 [Cadophora gregata]KAK0125180.1 KRRI-Interacting protein 1 [Cadophora gregata f. sp. sojae]